MAAVFLDRKGARLEHIREHGDSVIVTLSQEGLGCYTSPYTSNRICNWSRRYGWEVVNLTVQVSRLVDVHLFDPLKKHLAGRRLTTDAE
jgi:hypothetical protein